MGVWVTVVLIGAIALRFARPEKEDAACRTATADCKGGFAFSQQS